jgi:hypothetical protein
MLLSREKRTNFVEIILDFRRPPYRCKLKAIAAALGVAESTLKKWFYEGATPNYDDGKALVALHERVVESRQRGQDAAQTVIQPAPHRRGAQPGKEPAMAKSRPKHVQQPGAEPQATPEQEPEHSDVDAAIAAAQSGRTHKVAKAKPAAPPSRVRGDPERPPGAVVNAKPEMAYAEALALRDAGRLKRAVLTDQGWVTRNATKAEEQAAARSLAHLQR